MRQEFKNHMKTEYWVFVGLSIAWMLVIVSFFCLKNSYNLIDDVVLTQNEKFMCSVDYITDIGDSYLIEGWALLEGEPIFNYNMSIILWNEEIGQGLVVPVQYKAREDVTAQMGDGINYDNSGFKAIIDKDNLEERSYQVIIQYQHDANDMCVDTGKVLE